MAIKVIAIHPKVSSTAQDPALRHFAIEKFKWINDQTKQSGISKRESMFDWIVNKKGKAYIVKSGDTIAFIFGATLPNGQGYIRCVENGKWTDDLLELPSFEE